MFKNTKENYGGVAKFFHWTVGVLIICLIAVGFIMVAMPMSPDKMKLVGLHKSFGITLLTLAALRILWKAGNAGVLLPSQMRAIEKLLAHAGHAVLYVLMFAMPMTGWLMSSAAGYKVSVFGLFLLPDIMEPNLEMKRYYVDLHGTLAWILIGMITLHVLAVLMHHFIHKNDVLVKMLPFVKRPPE